MGQGRIWVDPRLLMDMLGLTRDGQQYRLQRVSLQPKPTGGQEIVLDVEDPALQEGKNHRLEPWYESMTDEQGRHWYRLKEVKIE